MRGRRRHIASLLAETLSRHPRARLAAAKAAFAEACGAVLRRHAVLRALEPDGRLVVVARSPDWAREVSRLGPALCARVNERLAARVARELVVHVRGPVGR